MAKNQPNESAEFGPTEFWPFIYCQIDVLVPQSVPALTAGLRGLSDDDFAASVKMWALDAEWDAKGRMN
jgi:hypothetical protein